MTELTRHAIQATRHCLIGCSIGEVGGMVVTTAFNLSNFWSIVVSIAGAFVFGYSLTLIPLLRSGLGLRRAGGVALASDTVSITVMELADNAFILVVPGAINAGLNTALFWISLAISLVVAFAAALPVNRWLIARGLGHAVVPGHH